MCRRPEVYIPPRPLLNHGPHRCRLGRGLDPAAQTTGYDFFFFLEHQKTDVAPLADFYQVVALSEPLPKDFLMSKPQPSREQVAEKIEGKVLGWGLWVGQYERKWE